ncbi:orotidine-5'-phosphate decarboxylase [candidate division KSB3 bacterium]|uniref:Orotidine 5'-phosphate decarboxylase n=1 Tax=candidate division KSB3 bacterium TaxID=2044937 RepID=A0A2G6KLD4_9BACT|nr:MAG: orotidine-5'-phosphate decarboxylase [candidate division KSB3 bacterium]
MKLTGKEQIARSKICLPLDNFYSFEEIKACIEELSPVVGLFKIGKELFTRFGPDVVTLIHDYGSEVFLDVKFHDIPNTVKGAAYAATQFGVYMFNVHASGGIAMMQASVEGAQAACRDHNLRMPNILGVTVLTSIDQPILNTEMRVPGSIEEQVLHLAKLSQQAGLNGIVCSAADLHAIRQELPLNFLYVTPGIKGPNTEAGSDQKRVFTPYNAIQAGSSILVVGRAITAASDRLAAGRDVLADIVKALR